MLNKKCTFCERKEKEVKSKLRRSSDAAASNIRKGGKQCLFVTCVCCNSMMLSCKVVILWAKRDDLRNILQRQSYAFLRCASATYWPAKKHSLVTQY